MGANQVASSHDAFDALLEASSLGAPRVQAVRRRTPAAVRDLLTSRLTGRSPATLDAAGQAAPPEQRVTKSAQPPLPRAEEGRDLQHLLRSGSGSHHVTQLKGHSCTSKSRLPALEGWIPYQASDLTQSFAEWADQIFGRVPPQSLLRRSKGTVAEASMKTGLFTQLHFADLCSRHSRIGRYGVGAGWPHSYGRNVFEDAWMRAGTDAAQHLATAVRDTASPTGPWYWLIAWADVSDLCARGMSTQTGRGIAPATRHVPGASAAHRTTCDACQSAADPDGGAYGLSAAVSRWAAQGSSRRVEERSKGGGGRNWWEHLLAVYGQGASGRSAAVQESEWEQLAYRLLGWPVRPCGCPAAHPYWRGMRASLEEQQTSKGTGPRCSRVHAFSECWSCGVPVRSPVSANAWPDGHVPEPASGFVMAICTAELLWTELSETLQEQAEVPLPLVLQLLCVAYPLRSSSACCTGAAQEATTVRENARLVLPPDSFRTALPVTPACRRCYPSTMHAAFEGMSGGQIAWTFAGVLVAGMESHPGFGTVRAWGADKQPSGQADPCRHIHVSKSEGEAVLPMNPPDLAQFLDCTREETDTEHAGMPPAPDAVCAELMSDAQPR